MSRPIRVLLVVDSTGARDALTHALSQQTDIEIVASAGDESEATRLLQLTIPDLIVLDIDMPRLDAIAFLRTLMKKHPVPTVICSSLAEAASSTAMAAFEAGAIDIIRKPTRATRTFFDAESIRIAEVIRAAAYARVRPRPTSTGSSRSSRPPPHRAPSLPVRTGRPKRAQAMKVVAVGASTGGTEAIRVFLQGFDSHAPPMVIVQHCRRGLHKASRDTWRG